MTMNVMDCTQGRPMDGVTVQLQSRADGVWERPVTGRTDENGFLHVRSSPHAMTRGVHRITLDVDCYYASLGVVTIFPQISTCFRVLDPAEPLHLMVLVTPYSYTIVRKN